MEDPKVVDTLIFMKKTWVVFLVGIYIGSFYGAFHAPESGGAAAVDGEEVLRKIQRTLFFALIALSFLIDIVQMRYDRDKAFLFLFLSLAMGGLADLLGPIQYKVAGALFGIGKGTAGSGDF